MWNFYSFILIWWGVGCGWYNINLYSLNVVQARARWYVFSRTTLLEVGTIQFVLLLTITNIFKPISLFACKTFFFFFFFFLKLSI
jgi:hypothetical protein